MISRIIHNALQVQTQVNVPDRVHADYLEDHVPYYIWKVIRFLFFYSFHHLTLCLHQIPDF